MHLVHRKVSDPPGLGEVNRHHSSEGSQRRPESEDLILEELGRAYFYAGDLQNMLAVYNTYLPRVRAKRDSETEAALFHNLAMTYAQIQNYDRAIALLNQAAKLHTTQPSQGKSSASPKSSNPTELGETQPKLALGAKATD